MSTSPESPYRTLKAKKPGTQQPSLGSPASFSGPTTFFLRSERDVERSSTRGRKPEGAEEAEQREDEDQEWPAQQDATPVGSVSDDGTFGVQSLENTISSTFSSDQAASPDGLSRSASNATDSGAEVAVDGGVLAGRKRKAGNPVHPKIIATGQRILSLDFASPQQQISGTASPASLHSAESLFRTHFRRGSTSSFNQPLTPLRLSPPPSDSAQLPSTPRSGSPKSFRLSDEEASIASDTGSQAVTSSSGEDEEDEANLESESMNGGHGMPQLVMPSIAVPTRRPFTERGRRTGRLNVMVVGARGIGKTSLIQSICRVCEDIVHVDNVADHGATETIREIGASTRPYPAWWTDMDTHHRTLPRRKSSADGVLERNLTFIDTPGLNEDENVDRVVQYFKTSLRRAVSLESMTDAEVVGMLSGDAGGAQIDVVIYVFDAAATSTEDTQVLEPTNILQSELLRYLCRWTNVIPVISRADTVDAELLTARKNQIMESFHQFSAHTLLDRLGDSNTRVALKEPYTTSSALGDDSDTIEASVLMSSAYLQPLVPSELDAFVNRLLNPENVAYLRHVSATKLVLWRREQLGTARHSLRDHLDLGSGATCSPTRLEDGLASPSAMATSSGSLLDDPSKVLVPHASSRFYTRSPSPTTPVSETAGLPVRLAKWALDLQRSLDNDRLRHRRLYSNGGAGAPTTTDSTNLSIHAGEPCAPRRPPKGRLGGALSVVDPLGLQRGIFALQLVGAGGLVGAVTWCIVRSYGGWAEVHAFLFGGMASPPPTPVVTGVPAPSAPSGWGFGWALDDANALLRHLFG